MNRLSSILSSIQWLPIRVLLAWLLVLSVLVLVIRNQSSANAGTVAQSTAADQSQIVLGFHVDQLDIKHLRATQKAGGTFVVHLFSWAEIEPTPGYHYWAESDASMRAARYYGVGVVARLDHPPAWARDRDDPSPWSLDAYAAFVQRFVIRYGDQLEGIILWNEPNLRLEWDNSDPDPVAYVALLERGAGAVRSIAPDLPILMAGLAFTMGGDGNENDLAFLQEVYEAGGGNYFDVLAVHAYGFGAAPDTPPAPDQLNFRRLELYRQLMAEQGDAAKAIWITEMGWRVRAPDQADAWQVVPPRQQAQYSTDAITFAETHYPWLQRMAFWQLVAQGDRYGFDLWQGATKPSLTYERLAQRCAQEANCIEQREPSPDFLDSATGMVEILAADTIIRLGDRDTLHPHWVHLHHTSPSETSPSETAAVEGNDAPMPLDTLQWRTRFFLSERDLADIVEADRDRTAPFQLILETMQVDQPLNRITLNGEVLAFLSPRARPDPTSSWVTQRFTLPSTLLRVSANELVVTAGERNPAWQYADWRWENFQFRHVRLQQLDQRKAPFFAQWQVTASPSGWTEAVRLRAASDNTLWLAGNHQGELWQVQRVATVDQREDEPTKSEWMAVDQSGNLRQQRVHDILSLGEQTILATSQGLYQRMGTKEPWLPIRAAPQKAAYAFQVENGEIYAAFADVGIWYTSGTQEQWQPAGLNHTTVRDLIIIGNKLYAATDKGICWTPLSEAQEALRRKPLPAPPQRGGNCNATSGNRNSSPEGEGREGARYFQSLSGFVLTEETAENKRHWQPLPPLPASAETSFVTRLLARRGGNAESSMQLHFGSHSEQGIDGELIVRANDRLWRWYDESWEAFGPQEQIKQRTLTAISSCCENTVLLAGKEIPLLRQQVDSGQPMFTQGWLASQEAFATDLDVSGLLMRKEQRGNLHFLAATTGLWSTEDTIESWQLVNGLPATVSDLLIDPSAPQRWLAATPVGLYRSEDEGHTWSSVSPPWQINDLAWGNDGRLLLARSRGIAWTDTIAAATVEWEESVGYGRVWFFTVASHPTEGQQLWGGTWGNDIGTSQDGGRTISGLGSGLETLSVLTIWWHAVPNQVTIGTIEGLYRSDDRGNSWFQLPGPLTDQTVYSLYQGNDGVLWAGTTAGLWYSTDYGVTWEAIDAIGPTTIVQVGTLDGPEGTQYLWAGSERDGWWLSPDEGNSWQWAGLADRSVFAIQVMSEQTAVSTNTKVVAATDVGIFTAAWPDE